MINAIFLPPDTQALESHEAIRYYYLEQFADPLFALECEQLEINVAGSGESAWSRGRCYATFTGEDGSAANATSRAHSENRFPLFGMRSKWTKIWEKQSSGDWKNRLNTWNMDP